jgi:DNA polymerase
MCAYAPDDRNVQVWQPHLCPLPSELQEALLDPTVIKVAWNSFFEHQGTQWKLGINIPFEAMKDPSTGARHLSIPGGLAEAGDILNLAPEFRKNETRGAELVKMFTEPIPEKVRKQATNENTLFDISPLAHVVEEKPIRYRDWTTHPTEWKEFVEYCRQDVVAERAIEKLVDAFPMTETERRMWVLDQYINARGIKTNREYARKCYSLAVRNKEEYIEKLKKISGVENPNSVPQMLAWVQPRGYLYSSLRKEPVRSALADESMHLTDECREGLSILKYCKKNSYSKLKALEDAVSLQDDRLRNQFLFLGSPRAGRWAGRDVQLQNMARPIKAIEKKGALEKAMKLIMAEDYEGLKREFPYDPTAKLEDRVTVIDVMTSCIRSAFVSGEYMRLDVCDLNAIENRVLGWVSGEQAILDVFAQGRCPYIDFAAFWFNIPYATLKAAYDAGDPDAKFKRQISKPAVLGCGYRQAGGGWIIDQKTGDRVKNGLWRYAEDMFCPMTRDQAHEAVKIFRSRFKKVVQFWYDCERAILKCLKSGTTEWLGPTELVWCDRRKCKNGKYMLRIHLPSGRCLYYLNAHVEDREMDGKDGAKYTKEAMIYDGIDSKSSRKVWGPVQTHGGKITENIVQAIARDILVEAMLAADEIGLNIVGHVHDEIITENPNQPDAMGLEDLRWCMSQTPKWAPGLPLTAEGWTGYYYKK